MIKGMARGWESKAVAAQIAMAEPQGGDLGEDQELSPAQIESLRRKESLMLSRSRVLHDLDSARNPRYRKILEDALRHLDHELSAMSA